MYVVPDAREVGVGDALVAAVRATASERGCAWLDALALPGDRALKNLYERNGLTARLLIASTRL
jgi:GNAT superfamily N-acetyltransferase